MAKSLFNFYVDDNDKAEAIAKLSRLSGEHRNKGALASCLRVLIKQLIATPDAKVNPLLVEAINAEYEYSEKKNKRSKL